MPSAALPRRSAAPEQTRPSDAADQVHPAGACTFALISDRADFDALEAEWNVLFQRCGRGTQVFLLDLHVDAISHYFEAGTRTVHVYGKPLVIAAAQRFGCEVLACTDAGRAKWVESLANDMGVPAAFVYKRRGESGEPEVTGVSAQVTGKRVVIYDDMIRTGGSLMNAARTYLDAGAKSIDAIATHGLFPGDSLAKLEASGLFGSIWVTDSHPRAVALHTGSKFLHTSSTAGVLIEHLNTNR